MTWAHAILLLHTCVIVDLSWKFYENQFIHNTNIITNRHTVAPRWEIMKQFSQSWNSPTFHEILWKSVHLFFHNYYGSRKYKNPSWIQGVNHIILKMFQIVHCVMSHIGWKFHENTFIRFPVMLLTGTYFLENIDKETQYPKGYM